LRHRLSRLLERGEVEGRFDLLRSSSEVELRFELLLHLGEILLPSPAPPPSRFGPRAAPKGVASLGRPSEVG